MDIKKNDIIKLNIDTCTVDGSGIGRYDGMAVFVPAAAAGDSIDAHILKVKKNYVYAKVNAINVPSPDRVEPVCPVFLKCGGCAFGHISYEAELKIKETHVMDCLKRIGGVTPKFEPIIGCGNDFRYRNKAQFPVEADGGKIKIGFFAPHSHRVVNCRDCLLQPAEFADVLNVFERYIKETGASVYDEASHSGLLRHIYIRKGTKSGEIMVCPVINGNALPCEEKLVDMLLDCNADIKSVIININKEKTNVILGKKCRTVYGNDYITDSLCGLDFRLSPLSFYQVNRDQAEKLYGKAAEYAGLSGTETVIDLYCGTGTIGLSMAKKARKIIGVEIVEQAIKDAKINAESNGIKNAEFICADASLAARKLRDDGIRPDVVILDPPRKGCSPDAIGIVADMKPDRIVYISCDPATLARDCALFKELGYDAVKAVPVDMFAKTGHVETVVRLVLRNPAIHIDIDVDVEELVQDKRGTATYSQIKDYVLEQTGLKVSNLNIAQVKQKYGIIERENYNKSKSPDAKQPQCTKEKEDAIVEALKWFGTI